MDYKIQDEADAARKPIDSVFWTEYAIVTALSSWGIVFENPSPWYIILREIVLQIAIYSILLPIAWKVGDWYRRFTIPNLYTADDSGEVFMKRMYWLYGPQTYAVITFGIIGNIDIINVARIYFETSH